MGPTAADVIAQLELRPHPEGGHYRETFRDQSVVGQELSDGARIADYLMNLVRPVVFTFLHDCAVVAHLRLSDVIEMRVTAERKSIASFALPLHDIVQPNGERLLWGLSA